MKLCANLSMLWPELPMEARFAAAARAGFDAVEIQFPHEHKLEDLRAAQAAAGLPVALINVPRGPDDAVGLAAIPGAEAEFRAAVDLCRRYADGLGAGAINILSGRPGAVARAECWPVLVENLRHAATAFAADGRRVVVEAVNPLDVPGFFLTSLSEGLEALARADHPNLSCLFDFYHMAITEPDLPAAIAGAGPRIGHVQFADAPGRHAPGSGRTGFAAAFAALRATGYAGIVSAEYRPEGPTEASLHWMAAFREMMA